MDSTIAATNIGTSGGEYFVACNGEVHLQTLCKSDTEVLQIRDDSWRIWDWPTSGILVLVSDDVGAPVWPRSTVCRVKNKDD